jgi:uncharacterized protein YabN with tetrapyrrole methylase and pyrophosphatase domain
MDAEEVLQSAIEKFRRRFSAVETSLEAAGRGVGDAELEELDRLWEMVKARERSEPAS